MLMNKTLRLNNLKTRTVINTKTSVFVICVEVIIYLLLYNFHACTLKYCPVCISINLWYKKKLKQIRKLSYLWSKFYCLHLFHFKPCCDNWTPSPVKLVTIYRVFLISKYRTYNLILVKWTTKVIFKQNLW